MNSINISVIIPAYNAEQYIAEAIDSVLRQTFTGFEIIIVDDCSVDNTWEIIKAYSSKDERIKIYKNDKNSGVSFTRNFGVSNAEYNWIAFLDADDAWREDKLQKQVELVMQQPDTDVVYTSYSFMNSDGKSNNNVFHVPDSITYKKMLHQNIMSCSGVMVKKKLMEQIPMGNDGIHEDFMEWLKILKTGAVARGIDQPLHVVRVAVKNSKSGNKFKSAIMTFKTYRALGLNFISSAYNMFIYIFKSLKKYSDIGL